MSSSPPRVFVLCRVQTLDIMRFRERLEVESETTLRITSTELITMCKERWGLGSQNG